MDSEEKKQSDKKTSTIWKLGWGWYLAAPLLGLLALAAGKGVNDTLAAPPRSALDILKERYAKGEIDRAEFEEKKNDLLSI